MTAIALSKLRTNLSKVIEQIAVRKNRYIVKKGNIPVTVMVNYDEYKNLIEENEDLRLACDPEVLENVRQAKAEIKAGKTRPLEDFIKELGL